MISITIKHDLPFVEAIVTFRGQTIKCENVLLDTGSAGTIFNVDKLIEIGVKPEPDDMTYTIYGVGGAEFVYSKTMDAIQIGDAKFKDFQIEIGAMDYGLELDGIIGFDFMKELRLVVDTKHMKVYYE
ncbi:retropepsin-like aspartic protease [Aneurinibacillus aneurinilyticus]|jgi:predicted aspartyl protease|uniref:retropepsin-like aspartic protease n=1 Tax=Aneurinibacillus aneurinilyticus TaxID=1391 RepID=UPI00197C8356|nr:retropepsin-like aspartic protease [Aneurinibacillus aneurinilyticus]MCI1696506.1 retropepsin-like domain-containing protein [Aneurinibacillus aneurinilyticus]